MHAVQVKRVGQARWRCMWLSTQYSVWQLTGSVMAGTGRIAAFMLRLPCHSMERIVREGSRLEVMVHVGVRMTSLLPPRMGGVMVSCSLMSVTRSERSTTAMVVMLIVHTAV